jgi:hypothetical protein
VKKTGLDPPRDVDARQEVQQHDVEQEQEQAQAEELNLNLNQMKPAPAANKRVLVQQVLVPDAAGAGTWGNKARARLHSIASNKLAAKGVKVRTHTNPAPIGQWSPASNRRNQASRSKRCPPSTGRWIPKY